MKITKEDLKQLILESMQELKEEADFKLPGKSYWENQKDLKEKIYQMALRYKKFKPLKSKNFELYPIIQEVYKNEVKSHKSRGTYLVEKRIELMKEMNFGIELSITDVKSGGTMVTIEFEL